MRKGLRKTATPNYGLQKPRMGMITREEPCCGSCSHVTFFCRVCFCNLLRGKTKNSINSKDSKVNFFAICDKFDPWKGFYHDKPTTGGVSEICKDESESLEDEIQVEHGRNSVEQSLGNTAGRESRPSVARLGKENSLRISPEQEDKTITVTIP